MTCFFDSYALVKLSGQLMVDNPRLKYYKKEMNLF